MKRPDAGSPTTPGPSLRATADIDDEFVDSTDRNAANNSVHDDLGEIEGLVGKKRNPVRTYLPIAFVVVALGFVIAKGLGNATSYFLQVDEAVAQIDSLKEKPFRLQGIVVADSVRKTDESVNFDISLNDKTVRVAYQGEPPELFREDLAVVVEGRFAPNQSNRSPGTAPLFVGDQIAVKHDENYIEKNEDRLTGAVDDPNASTKPGAPEKPGAASNSATKNATTYTSEP
jgi:cytochrome c-type biogenesis protein CcmE